MGQEGRSRGRKEVKLLRAFALPDVMTSPEGMARWRHDVEASTLRL